MKKRIAKKIDLGKAIRISTAVIFVIGLAALTATGLFIMRTLEQISNPDVGTVGANGRTEQMDEALLDRLLQSIAERTSDQRALPDRINNPFATEPPPEPPPETVQ